MSTAGISLASIAGFLREGRLDEAWQGCQEGLAGAPDDAAWHQAAAVVLSRLQRHDEALAAARRAAELAPSSAATTSVGNALANAGRTSEAAEAFQQALREDPANLVAAHNAGLALLALGQTTEALPLLYRHAVGSPMDFTAQQRVVDVVATLARTQTQATTGGGRRALGRVAIGICSVDAERERIAVESLRSALPSSACEFIVLHDAKSLAEAYNRILDRVQADVVILCHDDIEVLSGPMEATLAAALAEVDLVGVAGATTVSGPAVLWAGHPHVHGWVTYPRDGAHDVAPLSLRSGLLAQMQALDGVFLAMRGEVARELRFDAATFDGFHFYDLDFTYRAHLAGKRLAVSTDLRLLHRSEGDFGTAWQAAADAFRRKYPSLIQNAGQPHWYGARLAERSQVNAFYDILAGFASR